MPGFSTWVLAVLSAVHVAKGASPAISRTARCGVSFGLTCQGSSFGDCCSKYGYCGSTKDYCGDSCHTGWGTCTSSSVPVTQVKVSKNGECGTKGGATCLGSSYGDCCSQHGYCGSNRNYCGKGCNPLFGKCSGSESSATSSMRSRATVSSAPSTLSTLSVPSASPSSAILISNNARCGSLYNASPKGMTCRGSKFGDCCSQYSYCGSSKDYCGTGCQPGFGDCDALPASSSSSQVISPTTLSSVLSASATSSSMSPSVSSTVSVPSSSFSSSVVFTPGVSSLVQTSSSISFSSVDSTSSASSSSIVQSSTTSSEILSSPSLSASVPPSSSSTAPAPSSSPTSGPAGPLCGVSTYPNTNNGLKTIMSNQDLPGCTEQCLKDPACQYFFSYTTNCWIYTVPVSQQTATRADLAQVKLYERSCFPPAEPIPVGSIPVATPSSSAEAISSTSVATPSSSFENISSTPAATLVTTTSVVAPTTAATPSAAPACGVHSLPPGADSNSYDSSYIKIKDCTALCLNDSRCTFFVDISDTCYLYDYPYKPAGSISYSFVTLYQKECFTSAGPASSSPATTSSIPVSSTGIVTPTPSAISSPVPGCGSHLYPRGAGSSLYNNVNVDIGGCTTLCLSDSRCTFFAFVEGDACWLYDYPFDPSGAVPVDFITVYQRSCFPPNQQVGR